jgi:mono/diheme cytochrome c family protein
MKYGRILKIGGASVAGILLFAVAVVYGTTEARLRKSYDIALATKAVSAEPELVEKGRHLAMTRGCTDCHSADLGGMLMMDEPGVALVSASNLTRGLGGVGSKYSDADWERAIRHGVGVNGKALAIMPSKEYFGFGEDDTEALIAYLKTLPPVDREHPARKLGPIGRALLATGMLPRFSAEVIDHRAVRSPAPPEGETVEFGAYLAMMCAGCHGDNFAGGSASGPPGSPPSPNLTPDRTAGIGTWTEADFFRALREGRRPDDSEIQREFMPWTAFANMTDTELRALWLYFTSIPPVQTASR